MRDARRALVWQAPGVVDVQELPNPERLDGWAVIDVAYNGICGTDLHIVAGHHPRAKPPLILGHEIVGRLHWEVPGFTEGQLVAVNPLLSCGSCVACRSGNAHVCETLRLVGIDVPGGAAERAAVPVQGLVPLPEVDDPVEFSFVEPLAVAVHAVRRSGVGLGDRVLVAGAGPIGQAVVRCAILAGASTVFVVDPVAERRQLAVSAGAIPLDHEATAQDLASHVDGEGANVVFDTAGHPTVGANVLSWVATGGRVVVVGTHVAPVPVNYQDVTFRELEVIGSRVYTPADVERSVDLIHSGRFDAKSLISSVVPLDRAREALERLREGKEAKVLIRGRG